MNFSTHTDRIATLIGMLTYRRPAGTRTERRFIREHIAPLGMRIDGMGNLYKRIGDAPILWSCHTDTVHREGGRQKLELADELIGLPSDSQSNCLGADDTAGVWLMCEMIRARRPGLYIFHRCEERGGVGSAHIASKEPGILDGIEFAVALDRRGTKDVITHQAGGRSCSDTFATSLARALGMGYRRDDGGVFTDTANYTGLIGECTNLSVGYDREHTSSETLDLRHVLELREALLSVRADALTYERKPGEVDPDDYSYGSTLYSGQWSEHLANDNDFPPPDFEDDGHVYRDHRPRSMIGLIQDNPAEVADLLEEYGFDWQSLAQEIWMKQSGGRR